MSHDDKRGSSTPRTDALNLGGWADRDMMTVLDHARQLERELAQAREQELRLRADLTRACVELTARPSLGATEPTDEQLDDLFAEYRRLVVNHAPAESQKVLWGRQRAAWYAAFPTPPSPLAAPSVVDDLRYGDLCPRCNAASGIDPCPNALGGPDCPLYRVELPPNYHTARSHTAPTGMEMLMNDDSRTRLDGLVNRFLAWKLPDSVCSDQCATQRGYPHRTGTTLLTADEARQMLEHVLQGTTPPSATLTPDAKDASEPSITERDLSMLVRRLCRAMELSENPILVAAAAPARDYLKRKGLEGSVLRSSDDRGAG